MLTDKDTFEKGSIRNSKYDWLRFFATIFVVVGHSAYLKIATTYGGVDYILPQSLSSMYNSFLFREWRYLTGWVYGFHMPLFFMLSGAVLAIKPVANFDTVFKAKIKRLLIPYFVWGWIFMLPVKRLGGFYTNETLLKAMRGLLSGGVDSGHLWFLTALFWCLLTFVTIKKLFDKMQLRSIYALLMVTGICQLSVSYLPIDVLGFKRGIGYIFYFSLGYVFEIERRKHYEWNSKKNIFAIAVLIILEVANRKWGIMNSFFTIIAGSLLTYLMADLCSRHFVTMSSGRLFRFVSRNLFYVYIFHDPLQYVVLRCSFHWELLSTAWGCMLYMLSRTIGLFLLSLIMGESVGKIKTIILNVFEAEKLHEISQV